MRWSYRSLTAAFTAALAFSAPARAGGEIVFQTDETGNDEIFVMDADGLNRTNLSQHPADDQEPAWSPDGSQIAFVSYRDGDNEIFVMDADGSNQTQLTFNTVSDKHPRWSPDGNKITFHSARDGTFDIFVMDADGNNQTNLDDNAVTDYRPSWSPDGTKITFDTNGGGNWDIWMMDPDGTNQVNISNAPDGDYEGAWSPDGSRIAFKSSRDLNYQIYVMDADGANQTNLSNNAFSEAQPSWSAGGSRIVYQRFIQPETRNQIYVMDADGANQTNLSNNAFDDQAPDWSWASPPVNYRSIGTETAVLHQAGTADMAYGTKTVTFSGNLPGTVGLGDRLDIDGIARITRQEVQTVYATGSPATTPEIQGGTQQTYVLFVITEADNDVSSVTSPGLTWTERVEQCAVGTVTGIRLWTAQGTTGAFQAQITHAGGKMSAVLARYAGVAGFEDAHGENTNGEDAACGGGAKNNTARLSLTSTADYSMHVIGVSPKGKNVNSTAPAGYDLVGSNTSNNKVYSFAYEKRFDTGATEQFQATISGNEKWATAGLVLNPAAITEEFYVASRDTDTQVTTHSDSTGYHDLESYTIKRAYNALQDWEDSRQGDLVSAGQREVGVCYNDVTGPFTDQLVISGSTTDADHYLTLTVADGQRHNGTQNSGARIDALGGWSHGDAITVEDEYTRIEWLEIKAIHDQGDGIYFSSSPPADNGSVSNVYVHSFWQWNPNAGVAVDATNVAIRNCFMTSGSSFGIRIDSNGVASVENCTIIGNPTSGYGVYSNSGTVSIRNTISVNHVTYPDFYVETNGSAVLTEFANNMYVNYAGGFNPADYAGGNVSPPEDLDDLFVDAAINSSNLHLEPSGHDAIDTGLDLSADFVDDIDGDGRWIWDIGADEVPFNYRSVGTNAGVLHSAGTASIDEGSIVVTFSGTNLPSHVGAGDKLVIGADTYYLVARNSATQATVHSPSTSTHTADTCTITRAYNTFKTWVDLRGGDLVADDRREVAAAYDDDEVSGTGDFSDGALITGSTTDADHFLKITVVPGHRHAGVAGAGVIVDPLGGTGDALFEVYTDYTEIEWLQITNFTDNLAGAIDAFATVTLQNLLVYDFDSLSAAVSLYDGGTLRNSTIYKGDTAVFLNSLAVTNSVTLENLTIQGMISDGVKGWPGTPAYATTIRNVISVDNTDEDFDIGPADLSYFGYNMYSTVNGFSPGSYAGKNKTPPSDLEDLFISLFPGSEDLHLEASGHKAGNRGIDLSADFAGDIDGEIRSGGWDMGADEGVTGPPIVTPRIISWKEIEPQ